MKMNRVQFQSGLSMAEFMDRYGSDDKCETALIESRWPEGFTCPACGCGQSSSFGRDGRLYFQCAACRHQCSVISGTLFEATKLGLSRWFLAVHPLSRSKNNVATLELMRHLGVCYKTAWLIKQKLMERSTASIPVAFKAFGVVFNPAAQTRRSPQFDRADKRPLSRLELQTYWRMIEKRPGADGAALRLHILTGGQRIEQLVRLRWTYVADDALTIFDGKGRPGQGPRAHHIPLLAEARHALAAVSRQGEFALSTTEGKKAISVRTLAGWAHEIVGDSIEGFQLKRIRSGVETLLAASGVSREVRGHLQSHGLTGVQARHYDGHAYMPEKRKALKVLMRELDAADAKRHKSARQPSGR